MPLVYACICPHPPVTVAEAARGREAEVASTIDALGRVAEDIKGCRPDTVVIVTSDGPVDRGAIGVLTAAEVGGDMAAIGAPGVRFKYKTEGELARRIVEEAREAQVPVKALLRWGSGLGPASTVPLYHVRDALGGTALTPISVSRLELRFHFEFGRAIGRAVSECPRRVVLICSAELSHALPGGPSGYDPAAGPFDERYKRAVEAWDVRWMCNVERELREKVAEEAAAQTAVLMGSLSGSRVEPRVLSYEAPFGVGYLVAAIDILGPRRVGTAAGGPT